MVIGGESGLFVCELREKDGMGWEGWEGGLVVLGLWSWVVGLEGPDGGRCWRGSGVGLSSVCSALVAHV